VPWTSLGMMPTSSIARDCPRQYTDPQYLPGPAVGGYPTDAKGYIVL
jgi:hypothetical protein